MRALIFDLDGTLWDAVEPLTVLWQRELRRVGVDRVLTKERMIGGMGLCPEALAEHLERVLCRCPRCGGLDTMHSSGDTLRCGCGSGRGAGTCAGARWS